MAIFRSLRGFRRSHPAIAALARIARPVLPLATGEAPAPQKEDAAGPRARRRAGGCGRCGEDRSLRAISAPGCPGSCSRPPSTSASPSRRGPIAPCTGPLGAFATVRLGSQGGSALRSGSSWRGVASPSTTACSASRRAARSSSPTVIRWTSFTPWRSRWTVRASAASSARSQARWAAREEGLYDRIGVPSRVFVLRAGLACLRARKSGLDPAAHGNKVSAVNAIGPSELFSLVDAERRYEKVLLDLKRRIWSLL